MRIFLVRHGVAVPRDPEHRPDGDRFLTAEGRARFRKVARRFAQLRRPPTLVCTSRLVRAVQTAEILALELGFDGPVDVWPELSEEGALDGVGARLRALPPASRVAMVGHEPQLSMLVGWLIGRRFEEKFPKGAVVCLDAPSPQPGKGTFRWMLVPKGRRFVGERGEELRVPEGST